MIPVCPEHKVPLKYNLMFDKYTCTFSYSGTVAGMCGYSMYGEEANRDAITAKPNGPIETPQSTVPDPN